MRPPQVRIRSCRAAVVNEVDMGAFMRRAPRVDALGLQGPGFLQRADEGSRVAGILHGAGVGHFFALAGESGLHEAAVAVENDAKTGRGRAAIFALVCIFDEAAQAEGLGVGVGVEA